MKEGRKYLFNDALNTVYLWLYGVGVNKGCSGDSPFCVWKEAHERRKNNKVQNIVIFTNAQKLDLLLSISNIEH